MLSDQGEGPLELGPWRRDVVMTDCRDSPRLTRLERHLVSIGRKLAGTFVNRDSRGRLPEPVRLVSQVLASDGMVPIEGCGGVKKSLDDLRGRHPRDGPTGDDTNELIFAVRGDLLTLLDRTRGRYLSND